MFIMNDYSLVILEKDIKNIFIYNKGDVFTLCIKQFINL